MPHGTPDWGLVGPKSTTYGLDDLGEHAARLGSPHLFDRRGDILLLEDFRNGFGPFITTGSAFGWYAALSSGHSRQGAYSAKLVTGPLPLREATMYADLAYPSLSRLGLEFTFALNANTDRIRGDIRWDDSVVVHRAEVQYDLPNTQLQVYDHTAGLTPFANGVTLEQLDQPSHTLKLVADAATGRYVRCLLNDTVYDLSMYEVWHGGWIALSTLRVYIRHFSVIGPSVPAYIDNVIVTQNEP